MSDSRPTALDERTAGPDPIAAFNRWLDEAFASGVRNAEAMALATSTPEGRPSVRMVLSKGADRRGFVFYTNVESRKGWEIAANPEVALVFYWVDFGRQVRVEGRAEALSDEETYEYFRTRPRASRIGAWASPQSAVIDSREALEERVAELEETYPGDEIPLPPHWGGYRVVPEVIELWEHRDNRLHDRLRYTRSGDTWAIERLAP